MTTDTPRSGRRRPAAKPAEIVAEEEVEEAKNITAAKGRATPGRRQVETVTETRRGPLGRLRDYLDGVRSELDKVAWPTRQEVTGLFRVVLFVTIAAAIVLGLVAFLFNELFAIGLQQPILFVIVGAAVAAITVVVLRGNRGGAASPR
ncbi:MAG: preprotein translocase subunit SecE [Chloroflexi bacterium]|nr:preprotein translocase subunit SecE [Chloroflexota bacterium]